MTSTRDLVLENLLNRHRCTINQLAEAVNINPISVRHHIGKLEAEGLVTSEEERHGVGRPRRVYYLTQAGMEQFPTRYLRLTTHLLEQLKEALPEATVSKLFTQIASTMAEDFVAEINVSKLNAHERVELLKQILSNEGFTIEVEQTEDNFIIRETSCPYYHVGQDHPEICLVDKTLIATVLATSVEKMQCMLDGDQHCTYVAPVIPMTEIGQLSEI